MGWRHKDGWTQAIYLSLGSPRSSFALSGLKFSISDMWQRHLTLNVVIRVVKYLLCVPNYYLEHQTFVNDVPYENQRQ